MADYPYAKVQDKLKKFLQHIQTASIPPKINKEYLKAAGYKSSNDIRILAVLKFIGFLDSVGKPTEEYTKYRNKQIAKNVLGKACCQSAKWDTF